MRPEVARITKITPGQLGAVIRYVLPLLDDPCPPCEGTGVVMVAGGKEFIRQQAYASIRNLREVSDLPVQIWHLGPKEISQIDRGRFSDLDVEFVDAYEVRKTHPMHVLGAWECKSFAVAYSPFRNVLLLDCDCFPVVDPETLFNSHHFRNTGCIMWPDLNKCRKGDGIFPAMGIRKPVDFIEMEVGQLLIDKQRLWRAVLLTLFLNSHSEATYQFLWGDKDCWQMALRKLNLPFHVGDTPDWMGWGMSHKLDGHEVFRHYMAAKRDGVWPSEIRELMDEYLNLQSV